MRPRSLLVVVPAFVRTIVFVGVVIGLRDSTRRAGEGQAMGMLLDDGILNAGQLLEEVGAHGVVRGSEVLRYEGARLD